MSTRMLTLLATAVFVTTAFWLVWAAPTGKQNDVPSLLGSEVGAVKQNLSLGQVLIRDVSSFRQSLSMRGESVAANPSTPVPPAVYTSPQQGGDSITTAAVIPGMPFVDSGTTVGALDDYQENCGSGLITRPDVVFSYTPAVDELVDISLCNSTYGNYATALWVYQGDTNTLVACNIANASACSFPRSVLLDVPMDSALTYYIVVDGHPTIPPGQGQYVISCSATLPRDSVQLHPGFGDNGDQTLILSYEYNNTTADSEIYWFKSYDDGASFPDGGYWSTTGLPKYPSIDYWGKDTFFYGTLTPPASEFSGGRTYRAKFRAVPGGMDSMSSWNWTQYGWHNMRMADIACDTGGEFDRVPGQYAFGIISMVHSSTYTDPDLVNAPHIFYEIDTNIAGYATVSWYNNLNGCASTMCDIDKVSTLSYAVYDWWDAVDARWDIFIRRDLFREFNINTYDAGYTYSLGSGDWAQHPAVAVHNGSIVIPFETTPAADTSDHDIACYYDPADTNGLSQLATSVVVATASDERYPRVAHVNGRQFVCTYVANNALYMVVTTDGGETWGTPTVLSGSDYVVSEYRSADIADGGKRVVWEYRPNHPVDTVTLLHFANTNLILDGDGDGIEDPLDNCVAAYNPSQEDADADGIGDSCDVCTDTDGDGFGNPGFPKNTCALDNCPDDPNPGQQDTNNDGIGDACCCLNERGNADGIDGPGGPIDVSDLTYLVDYLFGTPPGPQPPCPNEGNVDGIVGPGGPIDVSDLTYLVDYLFGTPSGPVPPACP
ncbi:MAG TPA: thrombospondin type 3 repeat-containing protein [Candidatus Deferrimicrobium sp.]|nr:thrombospondin type 3 repeat-containing protein [Candidatus Deferrimicrobium sp.]